jgi:hypothetical protein
MQQTVPTAVNIKAFFNIFEACFRRRLGSEIIIVIKHKENTCIKMPSVIDTTSNFAHNPIQSSFTSER